jgi:putative transposase
MLVRGVMGKNKPASTSLGLGIYRLAGYLATPFAPAILRRRANRGKEDPGRISERLGNPSKARPAGPVVWLHAASVGEFVSLLPLIQAIVGRWPGVSPLVTTGTVTSVQMMAEQLPAAAIHQYVPVDLPGPVTRFLEYWRPALGIWVESELWPNALTGLHQRNIPALKVNGWGWMYLSTILDDYSRYIIAWKLCTTMKTSDVTDMLDLALQASGCGQAHIVHKPRLLSDNGSSYVSGDLAEWLGDKKMGHVRGAPYHPQTQGKIERWHQTLKNRILLDNYYFPADLEAQIETFVDHYNYQRYHESINNLTPADVYFGRGQAILKQRERIKRKTMETRRLQNRKYAA